MLRCTQCSDEHMQRTDSTISARPARAPRVCETPRVCGPPRPPFPSPKQKSSGPLLLRSFWFSRRGRRQVTQCASGEHIGNHNGKLACEPMNPTQGHALARPKPNTDVITGGRGGQEGHTLARPYPNKDAITGGRGGAKSVLSEQTEQRVTRHNRGEDVPWHCFSLYNVLHTRRSLGRCFGCKLGKKKVKTCRVRFRLPPRPRARGHDRRAGSGACMAPAPALPCPALASHVACLCRPCPALLRVRLASCLSIMSPPHAAVPPQQEDPEGQDAATAARRILPTHFRFPEQLARACLKLCSQTFKWM